MHISLENSIAGIQNSLKESKYLRLESMQQSDLTGTEDEEQLRDDIMPEAEAEEQPSQGIVLSGAKTAYDPVEEEQSHAEQELDEEFDESVEDLWEDMRTVTRKVLRHASDVLRSSQKSIESNGGISAQEQIPLKLNDNTATRKHTTTRSYTETVSGSEPNGDINVATPVACSPVAENEEEAQWRRWKRWTEEEEKPRRVEDERLNKVETLILAQKEKQLKREQAVEATRIADKEERDAAEKRAAAESAAKLLEASKKAREEAEANAAKEAEETKVAHKKAIAEAKLLLRSSRKRKKPQNRRLSSSSRPPQYERFWYRYLGEDFIRCLMKRSKPGQYVVLPLFSHYNPLPLLKLCRTWLSSFKPHAPKLYRNISASLMMTSPIACEKNMT